jgi:hypothetical protein
MPDWLCGPHTCFMAGWLYDFQTLIAGLLAGAAAFITVWMIRVQIRSSEEHTRAQIAADRENTEKQIAAQQELLDQAQAFEKQKARERIDTTIANEKDNLEGSMVIIEYTIGKLEKNWKERTADQRSADIQSVLHQVKELREQCAQTTLALSPLSIHATKSSRAAIRGLSRQCIFTEWELDPIPEKRVGGRCSRTLRHTLERCATKSGV